MLPIYCLVLISSHLKHSNSLLFNLPVTRIFPKKEIFLQHRSEHVTHLHNNLHWPRHLQDQTENPPFGIQSLSWSNPLPSHFSSHLILFTSHNIFFNPVTLDSLFFLKTFFFLTDPQLWNALLLSLHLLTIHKTELKSYHLQETFLNSNSFSLLILSYLSTTLFYVQNCLHIISLRRFWLHWKSGLTFAFYLFLVSISLCIKYFDYSFLFLLASLFHLAH